MSVNTMRISTDNYEKFKNLMHPNLRRNIKCYRNGDFYEIPLYHGCKYANRNGTRKRIDYKRGEICVLPTDRHLWKPYDKIKWKHLQIYLHLTVKIYLTRYMSNIGLNSFAKSKGNLWYDWFENRFKPKSEWFNRKNSKNFEITVRN